MGLSRQPALILVVEDEPILRLAAMDMVEAAGFGAIEARNADEAVAILERRSDVRIVFTDIDMPGSMDGMKLAAAIRDRWPPIKIVLTSGHCAPDLSGLPAGTRFFEKPYNDRRVIDAMRALAP